MTLLSVCCFGDNVLAAVRLPDGGRGAEGSAWAQRSGVALGVSPRRALPAQPSTAHAWHPLSLQHLIRRLQHAARQRMPPPPRVRPEGTLQLLRSEGALRVAQRLAHNPLAESAHYTGH
ncbi:hypothetical protein TcG_11309 [Trypanosoma cruzi]|nr:hypothetical protein TcG_11309 [Trypanosoma cruzi]